MENESSQILNFAKSKKGQWLLVGILIFIILIMSSSIRVSNLNLLKDETTGENIPLALDPYYFLRVAETLQENDGKLPEVDEMRYPAEEIEFSQEKHPQIVYGMFKLTKLFDSNVTLRYINVISPVIFFVLGIIVFFFLIYILTNSKLTALLSSGTLAFIPSYLYRTMAGFSDHESPGMLAFFSVLLIFTLGMKFLDKLENKTHNKKDFYKSGIWGISLGFLTALTIAMWGGIANYVFMIIPLGFLLFWILKTQKIEDKKLNDLFVYILYYVLWIFSGILISGIFGFSPLGMFDKYVLGSQGLITLVTLSFIFLDLIFIYMLKKKRSLIPKYIKEREKYRILFVLGIVIVLGLIGLTILKGDLINSLQNIINALIRPAGTGRLGTTVAENRAPYLNDWISQAGKFFFWLSVIGMGFIGLNISKGIRKHKGKIFFNIGWLILIFGILFSRISQDSLFNGNNFISHLVYFGSLIVFLIASIWIYFNSYIKVNSSLLIIASWALFMLISARSTVRVLFLMTPFFCFMGSYILLDFYKLFKTHKDELVKIFSIIAVITIALMLVVSLGRFYSSSSQQAQYTGPSANSQWQQTMKWVRENTSPESIFLHWWDYGYWVQTLGKRPSVADGGHAQGIFQNHLIGRYVLTTPNPQTAMAYMKAHNASYLLIDYTDLGKYGAYSRIGSDESLTDRMASLPVMNLDQRQTQETANFTTRIYSGAANVDEDITYTNEKQIFLPKNRAAVVGVILKTTQEENKMNFQQPEAVYIYNNQQYRIPLRYIYVQGQIIDFDSGIDAIFRIIPGVEQDSQRGISINEIGAGIYLSPMVSKSLFARLYLMDDPFDQYSTIELAHEENSPVVHSLQSQGALNPDQEFVIYQGFRGPIKIWDTTEIPEEIKYIPEMVERFTKEWGKFDDWEFRG